MFWGLVASSATICTNWVRAFWYCWNTAERDTVERAAPWSPGSRRQCGGARRSPYLAAPASDSWSRSSAPAAARGAWLVRALPASPRSPGATARAPRLGREPVLSVYLRLPDNRPEPERGPLASTVSTGSDVRAAGPRTPEDGQPGETPPEGAPDCQTRTAAAGVVHGECHYPAG